MDSESLTMIIEAVSQLGQYSLAGFIAYLFFDLIPAFLWAGLGFCFLTKISKVLSRLLVFHEDEVFFHSMRTKLMPRRDYGDLTRSEREQLKTALFTIVDKHLTEKDDTHE